MRDLTANYALLAGLLFFVGRLQVFPSLGDAFVAGLLASGTVAIALLGLDTVLYRPRSSAAGSQPTGEPLPHQHPDA